MMHMIDFYYWCYIALLQPVEYTSFIATDNIFTNDSKKVWSACLCWLCFFLNGLYIQYVNHSTIPFGSSTRSGLGSTANLAEL